MAMRSSDTVVDVSAIPGGGDFATDPGGAESGVIAASFTRSGPIAFGEMDHHFEGQQVGSRHHMPRAATAQTSDKILDVVEVQPHRFAGVRSAAANKSASLRMSLAKVPDPMMTNVRNNSW